MKLFARNQNPENKKRRFWKFNIPPLLFVALLALIYLIFATAKIIWNNMQFSRQLKEVQVQIEKLETENEKISEQVLYYQSDSFKEKEARIKFGLVKPGEKVLQVPPEKKPIELPKPIESKPEQSNWQKWLDYFFKKES